MLPDFSSHLTAPLADHLLHDRNLPYDFEVGSLEVRHVAEVAAIAAAHSAGYAATGHLLALLASLPAPTDEPHNFWFALWQASDSAYLLPANIKHLVLRALGGDGYGLAGQILSAVDEMTEPQRTRTAEVVGEALTDTTDFAGYPAQTLGGLWLRDLELTAWRVLHAVSQPGDTRARQQFRDAWKNA